MELIIVAGVVFGLFLIMRELMCWYFKINQALPVLQKIERHLAILSEGGKKIQLSGAEIDINENDILLLSRYNDIKNEHKVGYVDAIRLIKERFGYSDEQIQKTFKKSYRQAIK